jgi:hypothetical protein
MDCKSILSIYELAPHLADKPLPPRPPRSVNPRDLEIYRLHTVEKKTIRELANIHAISVKRIWAICTRVWKYGINESIEEKAPFTGSLSLAETM